MNNVLTRIHWCIFLNVKKTCPEILQRCESGTEEGITANAKIRKIKNVELLYIQKHTAVATYDVINICIHFV